MHPLIARSSRPVHLLSLILWATLGCQQAPQSPPPSPSPPAKAVSVADPADWCAGHGVPESMCPKCNSGVEERFREAGDWCEEHGFPESVCPSCNPMTLPSETSLPFTPGSRVRFRSARLEETAGIEVTPAVQTAIGLGVECTARIDFNRNRLADVRTSVAGIVREVAVDLGQHVARGQTLFVLESAQVSNLQARRTAAKERVGTARANLARQEDLREKKIPSARQIEVARQEVESAEAELRSIQQSLRVTGASQGVGSGRFFIKAPIEGVVVRRATLVGSFASESDSLAEVADLSSMWALLDVNEMDAAAVRLGQPVDVRVDGVPGRVFSGLVSWISAEVDARSRTVAVRAEIPNDAGLLRSNQFARATVHVAAPRGSVAVPVEAIQRIGEESVLFLRTGELIYEPRTVQIGRAAHQRVQVEGDVKPGDLVVTTGAFLIKTELMPGSIGAGCCEIEPPKVN